MWGDVHSLTDLLSAYDSRRQIVAVEPHNSNNNINLMEYIMYSIKDDKFESGTYTFTCSTRMSSDIPKEEAVETYVAVDLTGADVEDVIRIDPAVKFQNSGVKAAKGHFQSHEHFAEWASENATEENPHRVHFADLGKQGQFLTKREMARKMLHSMKAYGVDTSNPEAVAEWLEQANG